MNAALLNFLIHQRILKKNVIMIPTKILSNTTISWAANDHDIKMISEGWSNDAKNSVLQLQE